MDPRPVPREIADKVVEALRNLEHDAPHPPNFLAHTPTYIRSLIRAQEASTAYRVFVEDAQS